MAGQVRRVASMADLHPDPRIERRAERRAFLFLAVFLAPLLSVLIVGGWGFAVWLYQIVNGPPGP